MKELHLNFYKLLPLDSILLKTKRKEQRDQEQYLRGCSLAKGRTSLFNSLLATERGGPANRERLDEDNIYCEARGQDNQQPGPTTLPRISLSRNEDQLLTAADPSGWLTSAHGRD